MRWKVVAAALIVATVAPALFAHVAHVTVTAALAAFSQLVGGRG
ncbi:MAG TPA: hypothetical protein VFH54_07180 [Mycobacteriales bacterium]|nr:hypothetical protein [Mycobacteriales bacterium]